MNLSDYWQENKRFATTVIVGVLVFFIAFLMLDSSLGKQDKAIRKRISDAQRDLRDAHYRAQDRQDAEADFEALTLKMGELSSAVAFETRPEYSLENYAGSASNLYFQRVDEVRESLRRLGNRSRVRLPEGLDIEPLMTNDAETIARHLMALDLIDRTVRQAIHAGVTSIDRIRVQLDPSFQSKDGVGAIERTQVQFELVGSSKSVAALVVATQSDEYGRATILDDLEAQIDRRIPDRVGLSMTCAAISLHPVLDTEELD